MSEFRHDLVTALADNELNDQLIISEIVSRIENDKDLAIDYKVQILIKKLVKEIIKWEKTPAKVQKKILREINSNLKTGN